MEDTAATFRIKKLSNSNFHAWKQKISFQLTSRDLDQYVEEHSPKDLNSKKAWNRGDRKARAVIGLGVSDKLLEQAGNAVNAEEVRNMILKIFERHSLLNKLTARRKIYTVPIESRGLRFVLHESHETVGGHTQIHKRRD